MARVGTRSIGGFELDRSGEFIGLEYLKELFSGGSDAEHEEDQANLTKKKKALVSFPSSVRGDDWSELRRDISYVIADKTKLFAHLQKFGAACKHWHGVTDEINKTVHADQPPFLLLPFDEETQMATFVELKNCRKYELKMPDLHDQWICGASNGWLAMVDNNLDLFLFNPLTRARIKLPPQHPSVIARFNEEYDVTDVSERISFISRVVLSGDPSSSDCVIAIVYSQHAILGVCRLGDESWTVECPFVPRYYEDIIFYQGKFFAAAGHSVVVDVFEYDKQGELTKVGKCVQPFKDGWHALTNTLVESCGDLFLIKRYGERNNGSGWFEQTKPDKTSLFEVYKFEPNSKERQPWTRVDGLGDRSLFLGPNDCICMSVKEFPWCKPNRIYFTDDRGMRGYEWDNGVYSLEENRVIAGFDIQHSLSFWPTPAMWYQPPKL